MPTRGALGVGSVSYRGRGTIMRIERDGERAFRRERAERNTESKRDSRYSYRRGGAGSPRSLDAPSQRDPDPLVASNRCASAPSDEIICSSFPGIS